MALTSTTPNLNLILPTPTIQLGPLWATQLNAALETIDSHDHTSGKGLKIPSSGLNINAALDIQENRIINIFASQFQSQPSPLVGGSNSNTVHVSSGNLYFTNASGTAVQITSGGALVAPPGNAQIFEYAPVASNLIISPADQFVFLAVDTSVPRTITLPLANSVASGRIYIIKDATGNAFQNNITLLTSGSDLIDNNSSYVLDSGNGSWIIVGDGVLNWLIT